MSLATDWNTRWVWPHSDERRVIATPRGASTIGWTEAGVMDFQAAAGIGPRELRPVRPDPANLERARHRPALNRLRAAARARLQSVAVHEPSPEEAADRLETSRAMQLLQSETLLP